MRGKYGLLSMPWQRMRASHLMPAWVSCCKYSTCSRRFPKTSRSRHRYPSPLPTAWNPPFTEDGAQSTAVFHLSTRKSGHPTLCPKSWVGSPTNQVRGQIVPYVWLLLTTLWNQVGHGALDINPTAVPKVSLLPTASNQA